ncbi:MAG: PepSY-associated TM helix domain-containing protein [Methylobacter sp.]|nr:PepSY-associated TM helix domain-containing protein [Methylobacter sp.]
MQLPIKRLPVRAAWLKIHLYLALSAGFFFALMGLTGSISVYREELDELLNPQLVIEEPQGPYQSLDRIMAAVQAVHPDRYSSWTLEMPRSPHSMVTVWYDKPRETFFELYAPLMVTVNPYTAEVVTNRFWGQTLTTWLLDLHTQLQLARFGWNAVGILGLLLMISMGTGLYLWWPGIAGIGAALKIRHRAGMIRFAFDLHRLIGLLSASVLLLLAFTGFLLSYPSIPESLTGSTGMEHGETGRNIPSTAIPNNHPVGLELAEFIARGPFPRAELRRVTTPAGNAGIYRINLRQDSEINQRHPFTTVWVDRWSGHIKEVRNPARFSAGETIATWIWPLHTGEALGATGRFLWFLAGQSVFVLYVSGLLRWLYSRGMVKDREVNFALLKPHVYRLIKTIRRMSLKLFRLMRLLVHKMIQYAPTIKKGYGVLAQWLQRMLLIMKTHRRKRLGKIN